MVGNSGYVTVELLKNALLGIGRNQNTVIQEFTDLMDEKSKTIGILITDSTIVKYHVAFRHFKNFLKEKLDTTDIDCPKSSLKAPQIVPLT
jgi:hypothetical protein